MKKWYSVFTFLFMILLLNISTVYAEDAQTRITVENAVAEAGSNVDISLNLIDNPGICGATLTVEFDESLILTGVNSGSAFSSLIMTKPGNYDSNVIKLLWDGLEEDSSNGEIAELSFATPDQPGTYEISLSYQEGDIVDGDLNPVDVIVESGSITIEDNNAGSDHTDHSGGTATCISKAICTECGEEYGEINPNNHVHTEIRNKKDVTATEDGYTGDIYCTDCNALLEQGEVIPKYDIVIDDDAPTVYIEDATALVGKDIVIPVRIKFNPGIAGFSYDLIYDVSVMTLNSVSAGELLTSGQISTNGNVVNWYATDNINGDGTILNLSFTVAEDAPVGKVAVALTPHDGKRNLVDETGSYVEANYLAGMIDISKGIIGDVNGDDDITIADVVVLNRHVLGKTTLTEDKLAFADVNNDGDVTIGDVVVLNRRVLGKDTAVAGKKLLMKGIKRAASVSGITTIEGEDITVLSGIR